MAERLLHGALEMQTQGSDPKGCLCVISLGACGTEAERVRAEVIKRRRSSDATLLARMERAKAEGDLPGAMTAEGMVRYLNAVVQGLCVQASSGASPAQLLSLVETTLALWPGR